MTDECCATCEYWEQASTMAFQNPLEGIWGMCRLPFDMLHKEKVRLLTKSDYMCADWELD